MVVIMKPDAGDDDIRRVVDRIRSEGMDAHVSRGKETTIIGIIGDEREIDFASLGALPHVDRAIPILKPFKYVSREVCPRDRVIRAGGVEIGKDLVFIAGPCSVEDEDTTLRIAEHVREAGADIFRGGAYKPRTSPWSFQGLYEKGLEILSKVRRETGLPICTEIIDTSDIETVGAHTDIYQVGMRNMRNYALLTKLGKTDKPVLLKRGDSATLNEWLAAADYIARNGNENVILCERGIRTFETYTRNTLDLNAVVGAKIESCLPVIVDPSHGTGKANMVAAMSKASVAAGANGLMLEVHTKPQEAWSDAAQAITPQELKEIMAACRTLRGLQDGPRQEPRRP
jgi:3-deoxy-7-phosphoheptulonate synthase